MEYIFGALVYLGILVYCNVQDEKNKRRRKSQ